VRFVVHEQDNAKKLKYFSIELDKVGRNWFNISVMRQINRKNTNCWWWPAG